MSIYIGLEDRLKEFDAQHGNDPVSCGHWLLFADGAQRERQALGAWVDPPTDPKERAQLILRYHREKLTRAVGAFKDLRQQLLSRSNEAVRLAGAHTPPMPPNNEEIEKLRQLQAIVQERRKAVEEAAAKIEEAKTPQQLEREAEALRHTERGQAALAAIESIEV